MSLDYYDQAAERENEREDDRPRWSVAEHIKHLRSCIANLEGNTAHWAIIARRRYQEDLEQTLAAWGKQNEPEVRI